LPWLLIYAASYFYIAGLNLSQTLEMNRPHAEPAISSGD
jgi:hypothetical protein